MSDEKTRTPEEAQDGGSADPIARLLRLAGSRQTVPEERTARVRASVQARWREMVTRERRRRFVLTTARIAASLAVVVGAGLWLRGKARVAAPAAATVVRTQGRVLLGDGTAARTDGILVAGAGLVTGPDGRAALRLESGPSVRLDTGTDLRVLSAGVLELKSGAVYVDTEARFADGPAPPPGRKNPLTAPTLAPGLVPVEIRTPWGRVRDVGTQFEVRLDGDGLRVSVREGVAEVARDRRTYPAPAGTRVRVDARGAVESGPLERAGADWDWVLEAAPPFDMEGRTLAEYLGWLSRETGWEVEYADPSIAASAATIILHGSTSGLRPDESPAAVLPACGLSHRLAAKTLTVERVADRRSTK